MKLDRVMRFLTPFKVIRDKIDGIGRTQCALTNNMATLASEVHKIVDENRQAAAKLETLQAFQTTMETAGVRRKFGGHIDIDYDRFLNVLDPGSEGELARVIADRRKRGQKLIDKASATDVTKPKRRRKAPAA